MSRNIGALLGAIIGGLIGGPVGALQGFIQGYTIGAAFEDTQLPPGPRLQDLQQNDSTYGVAIPRVYGTDAVSANIIWMQGNQLKEEAREVKVQDGLFANVYQTQYFYSASFAVALCEGTIDGVSKIWANDQLIFERSINANENDIVTISSGETASVLDPSAPAQDRANKLKIRIYKGTLSQPVDPLIQAEKGEFTPAFRGLAYIVFENLDLTNERYRNSIPKLKFEIVRNRTDLQETEETSASTTGTLIPVESGNTLSLVMSPVWSGGITDLNQLNSETYQTKQGSLALSECFYYQNGFTKMTYTGGANLQKWNPTVNLLTKFNNGTFTLQSNVGVTTTYITHKIAGNIPSATNPSVIQEENVLTISSIDGPGPEGAVINVQNTPNYFVRRSGTSFIIGKHNGQRSTSFTLEMDANTYFNQGLTPYSSDFNSLSNILYSNVVRGLSAFSVNNNTYIYHKNPFVSASNDRVFWGLLRISNDIIEGLPYAAAELAPSGSELRIAFTGAKVPELKSDTYVINEDDIFNRTLVSSQFTWNNNIHFTVYAYDYENNKLYGILKSNKSKGIFNSTEEEFINTSDINVSGINALERGAVYELDFQTMDIIQKVGYISDAVITFTGTTENDKPILARVLDGKAIDFGHSTYSIAPSREESLVKVSNDTNEYIDPVGNSIDGTVNNGPGIRLTMPSSSTGSFKYFLLPDLNVSLGNQFVNLLSRNEFRFGNTASPAYLGYPSLQKEIVTTNQSLEDLFSNLTGIQIGELLSAELAKVGTISPTFYDFSSLLTTIRGFSIKDRGPIASSLKALQDAFLFDVYETDYKITGKMREDQTIVRTLPASDLGASEVGSPVPEIKITSPQKGEIPSQYYVTYRNANLQYEPDTVIWQDPRAFGNASLDVKVPVNLSQNEAYNLIRKISLATISNRRGVFEIQTSFKHSDLELADFIEVQTSQGINYTGRITSIDKGRPGIVKITGVVDHPQNYTFNKDGFDGQELVDPLGGTYPIPLIIDGVPFTEAQDGVGLWVGAYEYLPENVVTSPISFTLQANNTPLVTPKVVSNNSIVATVITDTTPQSLGSSPTDASQFDYRGTFTFVPLGLDSYTTKTEAEALVNESVNTFWYGRDDSWELIKIAGFVDNGNGTYTANGLLRGYKGTTFATEGRGAGDQIIAVEPGTLQRQLFLTSDLDKNINVAIQNTVGLPTITIAKSINGYGRYPLPPRNIKGYKNAAGDFIVEWDRASRYDVEWVNGQAAPLGESSERYTVLILDPLDDTVLDQVDVTDATNFVYTVTEQVIAYGMEVGTLRLRVAQFSSELLFSGIFSEITTV